MAETSITTESYSAGPQPASRRVLVTGGASGIGAATAELLAERGDEVITANLPSEANPNVSR